MQSPGLSPMFSPPTRLHCDASRNSKIAKIERDGSWIMSWGEAGTGQDRAGWSELQPYCQFVARGVMFFLLDLIYTFGGILNFLILPQESSVFEMPNQHLSGYKSLFRIVALCVIGAICQAPARGLNPNSDMSQLGHTAWRVPRRLFQRSAVQRGSDSGWIPLDRNEFRTVSV